MLLLVDAGAVALFGGWRLTAGPVDVSVSSGWRLVLAAGLLTLLRHALRPRPPLVVRLRGWCVNPRVSPAGAAAWAVCLTTRMAVLLVGILAVITIGFPQAPAFRVSEHQLANLPARNNAEPFLHAAIHGHGVITPTDARPRLVLPAMPLLMRVGGTILGASTRDVVDFRQRHHWRILWAGVLLSIGAFVWALVYLHELAADLVGADAAFATLLLVASYPFAVAFGAVGPDSLLLLTALGAICHMRREQWAAAALWAGLGGVTDLRGAWMVVPLAWLAVRPVAGRSGVRDGTMASLGPWVAAGMPLVGLGLSVGTMSAGTDDWPALFAGGLGRMGPGVLDLAAGALAAVLFVPVGRRLGAPYALLVGGFLAIGALTDGPALGRLSAVCVPLHLDLAARLGRRHLAHWTVAASGLQGWLALMFYTWRV